MGLALLNQVRHLILRRCFGTSRDQANLLTAVFEAVDLAVEGHAADGYQVLLLGRQKALEGEANFEPWADAVEAAWDGAIRR